MEALARVHTDTVIKQSNSIVLKHSNNKVCKNRIEMPFKELIKQINMFKLAQTLLKRKNAELVADFYNHNSNFALNEIALTWYASNSKIFSQRTEKYQNEEMDFRTSRLYLLGEYEDHFENYGHREWKPSKDLIELGWKEKKQDY